MNPNMPNEEDFRKMRIFLKCFFALLILILLSGMTYSCREKHGLTYKTFFTDVPKKERPRTILWQTEL